MNVKDIIAVVGLAGLILYQASQYDFAAATQTVFLVLGYFGLLHKADETTAAVGRNAARLSLIEDHQANMLRVAEEVGKNAVANRRTK